jgi:hypothetical protein
MLCSSYAQPLAMSQLCSCTVQLYAPTQLALQFITFAIAATSWQLPPIYHWVNHGAYSIHNAVAAGCCRWPLCSSPRLGL